MSISTTSGRSSSTSRRAPARPSPASPTTSRSGWPPSISAERRAHQRVVVDDAGPDHGLVMPPTGSSRAARTSRPRGVPRAGRRAARPARRSPTSPSPAPGRRRWPKPSGLRSTTSTPVLGRAAELDGEQAARGVLAGVGDALLDDPVDGPADRVRHLGGVARPGRRSSTLSPPLAGLVDQLAEVGVRRLRRPSGGSPSGVAQHAEHAAQVGQRLVGLVLDHRRAGAHLARASRSVAERQRAGVHGDLGDPVGQHVVHLAGDPGPLVGPGLRDAELLLGLGALGAVPQGPEQLAARADVHAPAEDRDRDDDVDRAGSPTTGRCPASGYDHVVGAATPRSRPTPITTICHQTPPGGERHRGQHGRARGGRA